MTWLHLKLCWFGITQSPQEQVKVNWKITEACHVSLSCLEHVHLSFFFFFAFLKRKHSWLLCVGVKRCQQPLDLFNTNELHWQRSWGMVRARAALLMPTSIMVWQDFWNKSLVKKHDQNTVKGKFSMIVPFHKWLNTDLWVITCNFSLFSACLTLSRPRLLLPVSYDGIREQKACFVLDLERHSSIIPRESYFG